MKSCPTSNMNRSQLWGCEITHIVSAIFVLAGSNIILNILNAPLFISWGLGLGTLLILRIISHGQKNGHLELLFKFITESHLYLGHSGRTFTQRPK